MPSDDRRDQDPPRAGSDSGGEKLVRELERLAHMLEDVASGLRNLKELLAGFLPKIAERRADEESGGGAAGVEPPIAPAPEEIDALVERQFREVFGDDAFERAFEPSAEAGAREAPGVEPPPVEAAESSSAVVPEEETSGPRSAGLWLRVRRAGRTVDLPWSWVKDAAPAHEGSGGRMRLEDGTGQAEIVVEEFLGVISGAAGGAEAGIVRLERLDDLVPELASTGAAAGRESPTGELPALDSRSRRVVVVSPSGIVRRFLRRHLEACGLEVLESESAELPAAEEDLLGIFLDRDATGDEPVAPELPVVHLSRQVERSHIASGIDRPTLAKPFAREDVDQAVSWMRHRARRSASRGVTGDERTDPGTRPAPAESGDLPPSPDSSG